MKTLFLAICLILAAVTGHAAVVLQYHHVDTETPPSTSTSPEAFKQHLDYIANAGLKVVPLAELIAKPQIPNDNRVAITFDDAFNNLLSLAIPTLNDYGWPYTIFVATEFVGQNSYLSWDQLRDMEQNGGSIGNHTHSHLHMVRKLEGESHAEWLTRLEEEITRSQSLLEANLINPQKHFAYPYGEYNLEILELIDRLGFIGFGQQSGAIGDYSDKRLLPRYPLGGVYAGFNSFKVKAHTQAMPAEVAYVAPLIADNPPTFSFSFPNPEGLRLDALRCYGPGGETELESIADGGFKVINKTPLPVGRSRYNCTMPIKNSPHYYWLSQLWMQKRSDGSWYAE